MTARTEPRRETVTRVAIAIALCLALLGVGAVGRGVLADESAQAHAYVEDGQRALAHGDRVAGVLALERARLLAPREHLVRAAIDGAAVNHAEPPVPRVARLLTLREWSAIATTFGWISGLGIAFAVARWHRRYAIRVALAAGFAFVVGMGGIMGTNASASGVVTHADTQLLVAPYASALPVEALPAGTTVLVGPGYDAFVQVKAGDGETGWLPRDCVEAISGSEG